MTVLEVVTLAIAFANTASAAAAAAGIWYGIRAMVRASDERGQQQRHAMQQQRDAMQQQRDAMQQQRDADERRHEENMTALKALIGGLERQTAALETVVERTASGPAAP